MDVGKIASLLSRVASEVEIPEGYEYWECGISITLEAGDKSMVITLNSDRTFTVMEYFEGAQRLRGESLSLGDVVKAVEEFEGRAPSSLARTGKRLEVTIKGEVYTIRDSDTDLDVVRDWKPIYIVISNNSIAGIPVRDIKWIKIRKPGFTRKHYEIIIKHGLVKKTKLRIKEPADFNKFIENAVKVVGKNKIKY